MKEVRFLFHDGSEYVIRPSNVGDTIIGVLAHKIMHDMNRHFGYTSAVLMEQKISFILSYNYYS